MSPLPREHRALPGEEGMVERRFTLPVQSTGPRPARATPSAAGSHRFASRSAFPAATHSENGQLLFQLLALAGLAGRARRTHHQDLKLVAAFFANILEQRHRLFSYKDGSSAVRVGKKSCRS